MSDRQWEEIYFALVQTDEKPKLIIFFFSDWRWTDVETSTKHSCGLFVTSVSESVKFSGFSSVRWLSLRISHWNIPINSQSILNSFDNIPIDISYWKADIFLQYWSRFHYSLITKAELVILLTAPSMILKYVIVYFILLSDEEQIYKSVKRN